MRRVLSIALVVVSLLALAPPLAPAANAATLPPNHAQFVARVVELVNAERQRAGLPPLVANGALMQASQGYAGEMADTGCFNHACGSSMRERVERAGYTEWTALAENIAFGYATPEDVMAGWMGSSGHRANILNATYRDLGVGLALRGTTPYWVQNFGASRAAVAPPPPPNCTVRPTFTVRSRRSAAGVLEVTVAAGTTAGAPNNTLRTIQFGTIVNGTVDLTGYGRVNSGTTASLAAGVQQATIVVRRTTAGAATTVPLVLTDDCGTWRTFVGAGAGAL